MSLLGFWMGVGVGGGEEEAGGGGCGILPDMGDIWFLRFLTRTLKRVLFRPLLSLCSRSGSFSRVPNLYQLKFQCINAQLNEKPILALLDA